MVVSLCVGSYGVKCVFFCAGCIPRSVESLGSSPLPSSFMLANFVLPLCKLPNALSSHPVLQQCSTLMHTHLPPPSLLPLSPSLLPLPPSLPSPPLSPLPPSFLQTPFLQAVEERSGTGQAKRQHTCQSSQAYRPHSTD